MTLLARSLNNYDRLESGWNQNGAGVYPGLECDAVFAAASQVDILHPANAKIIHVTFGVGNPYVCRQQHPW
jgi:hypothetical protein